MWVNILPVSAQTQLSASAQIQSAAPWGTETVKETRAYYDGAYWRVPAGWYHYQPTKDVWKDLSVSNSEDYFTDYYVAVWKKADGGYELAGLEVALVNSMNREMAEKAGSDKCELFLLEFDKQKRVQCLIGSGKQ